MTSPRMHRPVVVTDGGPWAVHDYACPVCQNAKAMLDLNMGVFQPCARCQQGGWRVAQSRRRRGWRSA